MMRQKEVIHVVFAAILLVSLSVICSGEEPATATTSVIKDSPYVPAGYKKVFGDEFDGASLSLTNWWTRYIYNNGMLDTLNDEKQLFRENNNHVMTGTTLQLTARKVSNSNPRFQYESGMIRSKMTFKYGYYESRLKVPGGLGVWPAFWLNSDSDANGKTSWPPEIDILEFVNNGKDDRPDMVHMTAQVKNKKGEPNPWGGEELFRDPDFKKRNYYAPFKFPDDFHVFGLLWDTDDTVTWFVDGKKLFTVSYKWVYANGKDAPNAHVLLNLSIGGQWAGRYGVDDKAFPQALDVDYVRVYQKPDQIKTGQSTIGKDLLKDPNEEKK
ncbi:MAG: hypothetical protein A2X48_04855 [Lentisphaerae bacterium GWF2_49_21]|nr:MAG: hypothetical protein A2X48_04855 [Lentisphaerae bacterium GWF2_49_21]